jgi:hypothetical protein
MVDKSIQLQWGWAVLLVGSLIVIYTASQKSKGRAQGTSLKSILPKSLRFFTIAPRGSSLLRFPKSVALI